MDLIERIEKAKKDAIISNSAGAALYIAGITDQEEYHSVMDVDEVFLSPETQVEEPKVGDVVIFRSNLNEKHVRHIGVITETEPDVLLVHREDLGARVKENISLRTLQESKYIKCSIEFYRKK